MAIQDRSYVSKFNEEFARNVTVTNEEKGGDKITIHNFKARPLQPKAKEAEAHN